MVRGMIMRFEIELHGPSGRILLDGQDVSHGVRGVTLNHTIGHMPELEIDVVALDASTMEGEARIIIPEATAAVLKAIGWTPPEGV
jgi:hypothetical protein